MPARAEVLARGTDGVQARRAACDHRATTFRVPHWRYDVSPASRFLRVGAAAALAAALLLPAAAVASDDGHGRSAPGRIFVIMLENHSQSTVIGDPNAPFINSLANRYGLATSYYGVTHPSQPNYVAAITGQLDITRMNDVATNTYTWPNLVDQLQHRGRTWGAYMEGLPYAGYTGATWPGIITPGGSNIALYTNKHDPFVLMTAILSNPARLANIKPYTSLAADLNSHRAPDFVWISPDQCNDMHGGVYSSVAGHPETPCPYGSTVDDANDAALKQKADAFVAGAVTTIRNSKAWTANSAIFILTDESDFSSTATTTDLWSDVSGCCDSPGYGSAPALPAGYQFQDNGPGHFWYTGQFGGGLVPAIVVTAEGEGPIRDATPYNHYSLLRTIEQYWHLGYLGYAGDSANVPSMSALLDH
jgi:phosphatidylinositol-3-phosphatase